MTRNKRRMSSLPGCLNHRILWVALVIPLAACSPGPSRHANLNPRVPELTLAYPPTKRDNVIDDYNGVRVADPNRLSTNGSLAVVGYVVSHDGNFLAYGVSQGGSDWTDWHIRELASGNDLPDVLRWTKYYRPVFTRDGKGLYYSAFPAPRTGDELSARDLGNA